MPGGLKGFQKGNNLGIKFRKGKKPINWSGGKSTYWREKAREVMKNPNGIVHHIDGDITNNSISNLQVLASQGEHVAMHNKQRKGIKHKNNLQVKLRTTVLELSGSSREIAKVLGVSKNTVLRIRRV